MIVTDAPSSTAVRRHPSLPYVLPFVVFLAFLALQKLLPFSADQAYTARVVAVAAVLLAVSRPYVSLRTRFPLASIGIGLAVFAIWVAPDLIWPGYRSHWMFTNSLTGAPVSSLPAQSRESVLFIAIRVAGSALLVPVVEELFWRAWLMRWLIDRDFLRIPLGTYVRSSFWLVAVLFASEHGPYWEVGLAAGAIYNWWIVRTKSLGDCILAHAVTNAALSAYVLVSGEWQYWL